MKQNQILERIRMLLWDTNSDNPCYSCLKETYKLIADQQAKIEELEKLTQWQDISTAPSKCVSGHSYLVYSDDWGVEEKHWYESGEYKGFGHPNQVDEYITHWMHLPKLPAEE